MILDLSFIKTFFKKAFREPSQLPQPLVFSEKEKRIEGLERSIRKWELVAYYDAVERGTHDCHLCNFFYDNEHNPCCEGCPVSEHSGLSGCKGTPFVEWRDFVFSEKDARGLDRLKGKDYDHGHQLAVAELEFLKMLLEKEYE